MLSEEDFNDYAMLINYSVINCYPAGRSLKQLLYTCLSFLFNVFALPFLRFCSRTFFDFDRLFRTLVLPF